MYWYEPFYLDPGDLGSRWNFTNAVPEMYAAWADLVVANVLDPDRHLTISRTGLNDRGVSMFHPAGFVGDEDDNKGRFVGARVIRDYHPDAQIGFGLILGNGQGEAFEVQVMPDVGAGGETWSVFVNCCVGSIAEFTFSGQFNFRGPGVGGGSVTIPKLQTDDMLGMQIIDGRISVLVWRRAGVLDPWSGCWEEIAYVDDPVAETTDENVGEEFRPLVAALLAEGRWYGGVEMIEFFVPVGPGPYDVALDDFALNSGVPFNPCTVTFTEAGEECSSGMGALLGATIDALDPLTYPDGAVIVIGFDPALCEWVVVDVLPAPDPGGADWPPTSADVPAAVGGEGEVVGPPISAEGDPPVVVVVVPPEDYVVDPDSPTGWTPGSEYVSTPTVTPSTNSTVHDYAGEVLDVVNAALAATAGGAITRSYVSPGLPALDCEQVTVSVVGLTKDNTGPTAPPMATGHRHRIGSVDLVAFAVTIARNCVPVAGTRGGPPDADSLTAAALVGNEDVWAVWNALGNAMNAGDFLGGRCRELYLDSAIPLSTSGQIAGWLIQFRAQVDGVRPGT